MDCIFCKIAEGEIPSFKLAESEDALAFLDIAPIAKSHGIVIPKQHFNTALESEPKIFSAIYELAIRVAKSIQKVIGCSGFNFLINNGETAGQTVYHLHLHIIPRFDNDEIKWSWNPKTIDKEAASVLAEQIRKNL